MANIGGQRKRNMSFKAKILQYMIMTAVLVAIMVLASVIMLFSRFVDSEISRELDRTIAWMRNELESQEERAAHASHYYADDPALILALESGNMEALAVRAKQLHLRAGVDTSAVTDCEGTVLVRPHDPEMIGDDATVMSSIRSALTGKPLALTEDDATALVTCAAHPIFNEQGKLLGAVVVGFRLETDEFVDRHKNISEQEITILRDDVRVATTVRYADGTRAVGDKVSADISKVVLTGEKFNGQVKLRNMVIQAKSVPLFDADGKVIGTLLVGHYLSDKNAMIWIFIAKGTVITLLILGLNTLFILFISRRIAAPISKRLEQLHYDALTGIYNRRYFDENIKRVIRSVSRSGGTLSLMMLDIDFFKRFNDTYGHNKGDDSLRIVAATLAKTIARADDFVVRYGGEEFVVVLPNTDEHGARVVANNLLENVRNCCIPHLKSDIADHVTISIGITSGIVTHTQCGDDYVKRADEMLYVAKQNGRNRYCSKPIEPDVPFNEAERLVRT